MSSLEELSTLALARDPARPAVEYKKQWIGWGEMRQVADRMNQAIDASGADPQGPVVLIPRNRPSALAAFVGLTSRRKHVCMVHVYQSPSGIVRDIMRLKPAVVVAAAEDFAEEVIAALKEQGIAGIALSEMDAQAVGGCERSSAICDAPPPEPQIDLLTSGTTGPPKQFPLTYDTINQHLVGVAMINAETSGDAFDLPPYLLFYPFGNFSGLYGMLPPIANGVRGVIVDRFNIPDWHDYVVRHRPETISLPTAAFQMILEADIPPADLSSLKCINSGASPLDPTVQRAFLDKYDIPILLVYGATEFGGPVTAMSVEDHKVWGRKKIGSVGRPFAGAQLRVIDPDTEEVLPIGQEGLLELIAPRIGPDWIRTSDIAVIDEDGFLWHRGRADGAIMRGGFKLLPDVIERALTLHEAVSSAGVTAVPDKRLGQVPGAAVQLKPGVAAPTIAELEQHLRENLEATHIPVHWKFVESLPYTAMVKVDRAALRRLFETADAA